MSIKWSIITGRTVSKTHTRSLAIIESTITGGSVKVLNAITSEEILTSANSEFMQKITHAIPEESSDVTITDLSTTATIDSTNFNQPASHADNNKPVTYSAKLDGADGGNYTINYLPPKLYASITTAG